MYASWGDRGLKSSFVFLRRFWGGPSWRKRSMEWTNFSEALSRLNSVW